VNDPRDNTVPGAQSVDEDSTLVFNTANSNLISVADADHAALSVTLTVTKGRLTLSQTTGLTFVIGSNGESRMKFSGSITDINAALNGLIYAGNPDFTGSDSLTILSEDNDVTTPLSDSDVISITVNPVNDASVLQSFSGVPTLNQLGATIDGDEASSSLGAAIAMSANGQVMVVGVPQQDANGGDSGQVRVYQYISNNWVAMGSAIAGPSTGDFAGNSVAISSDGLRIAIGAPLADNGGLNQIGKIRVYDFTGVDWQQVGNDVVGTSQFDEAGSSIALSGDGSKLVFAARKNNTNTGFVGVYTYDGVNWVQQTVIYGENAGDEFGSSVALSRDGSTLVIGAKYNDEAFNNAGKTKVYTYNGSSWVAKGSPILGGASSDQSGHWVSVDADGSTIAIGSPLNNSAAGLIKVYEWTGSVWSLKGSQIAGNANDILGMSFALNDDGDMLITGAIGADAGGVDKGVARIYRYAAGAWTQVLTDIEGQATDDQFGRGIAISADGKTFAVGAQYNDPGAITNAGQVRVYQLSYPGSVINYVENDAATVIEPALVISDIDDINIESATVTITANYANGQDVLGFVNTANITGSFNTATGVLTLTGTDTLANYQTALRSVTYQNTSLAPSELSRTVSFKVNDGDIDSAVLTATVNVAAVNSAPVNTIPATQVIKENNTLVFNTANANVISIADDNSNSTVN
ncbi:hypothetical protein, partial [Cysteiniphilum sp. SYW-8]